VPDPSNPQSLNRYSYCLNNPLCFIDPSGHETQEEYRELLYRYGVDTFNDVIICGGSGQPREELVGLARDWQKKGLINPNDHITILEDHWPESPFGFDVSNRLEQLYAELRLGHSSVMLLGFSEGAATVTQFLWDLVSGEAEEKMGLTATSEIKAAVLFECTNGYLSQHCGNRGPSGLFQGLNGLPDALIDLRFRIRLADVWNTASIVHGGQAAGWEELSHPYDSRPLFEQLFCKFGGSSGQVYRLSNTNRYHGNPLWNKNSLTVMHDTFYP